MPITFTCENCHSSFTVDEQLAGRAARCRKCNHRMVIPSPRSSREPALAGAIAATENATARRPSSAAGRNAGVGAAEALRQSANEAASRPIGWLDAVNSQIGLKPVTMMAAPAIRRRELEEPEDDGRSQYKVLVPRELRPKPAIVTRPAEFAVSTYFGGIRSYRQFFNLLAVAMRWVNETAYLISVIFLNVAIVGAIMSKHSLVVLGISMIVLLNAVQLVAGVANLIAIQFRGNIAKGLLFLFPPVTAYYLWKNWNRWHKAIKRITGPIVWLVVVVTAYAYVPWLNGSKSGKTSLKQAVESIRKDVRGTVQEIKEKATELEKKLPDEIDTSKLDDLKQSAAGAVDDLKARAEKAVGGEQVKPGSAPPASKRNP